ncbi:MAG TPA: bifunctional diaminohydroxyphosphoribosylaminopyrimidine deaminase/5-amino-6-(5-phosphoribosylamino)uracil reductase RibD [Candidatus Eremiobacteraceae bacterium]|nr:bifunctional diaminohydroxyphosphoribosylaminopyrimidine deaminase/5-amino-6-(5-phosphoribosylamino)uracil reductase RibD [Candidatus Eremiobacteraceae bacterium]
MTRRTYKDGTMRSEALMTLALAEAERALGNTSPNPMVGAVIARGDDEMPIAFGYHERAGTAHAEAVALGRAGAEARGATLYVNLEPCDHEGATPPCTRAIIEAGIARVVVATLDEDERARGAGIRRLRAAGIHVELGCGEERARELNRMYLHQRRTGRAFVTLKMAQSLDGAIAPKSGERYALTGRAATAHVRRLRFEHDAVMVGIGTVLVDDPQLTVRPYRERAVPYRRIVVDSSARLPLDKKLVTDRARATTLVATNASAPRERIDDLRSAGIDVLACGTSDGGRVDLRDLLERLGSLGMLGVLCEGGPTLASALLEAGLVDELHTLVAPVVLGTAATAPAFHGLSQSRHLRVRSVRKLGDDVLIVSRPDGIASGV